MLIFEYSCRDCNSIFKALSASNSVCMNCDGKDVDRVFDIFFKPNKGFCPKEKPLKIDRDTAVLLGEFINDDDKKCGGCSCENSRYSLKSLKTHS